MSVKLQKQVNRVKALLLGLIILGVKAYQNTKRAPSRPTVFSFAVTQTYSIKICIKQNHFNDLYLQNGTANDNLAILLLKVVQQVPCHPYRQRRPWLPYLYYVILKSVKYLWVLSFCSGLSSKGYCYVHWRRLADVQEGYLICGKWLPKKRWLFSRWQNVDNDSADVVVAVNCSS